MRSKYLGLNQATMLVMAILLLSFIGDGSDGRHVCTK